MSKRMSDERFHALSEASRSCPQYPGRYEFVGLVGELWEALQADRAEVERLRRLVASIDATENVACKDVQGLTP